MTKVLIILEGDAEKQFFEYVSNLSSDEKYLEYGVLPQTLKGVTSAIRELMKTHKLTIPNGSEVYNNDTVYYFDDVEWDPCRDITVFTIRNFFIDRLKNIKDDFLYAVEDEEEINRNEIFGRYIESIHGDTLLNFTIANVKDLVNYHVVVDKLKEENHGL